MNPGWIPGRARNVFAACLFALAPACGDDDASRTNDVSDRPDGAAEIDVPEDTAEFDALEDAAEIDAPEDLPDAPEIPNRAPTLSAPADATMVFGHLYEGTAVGADPDLPNDTLTFEVTDAPTSLSLDRRNGRIVWAPREADVGAHTIVLVVTDQGGLTASASFTITVVAPGAPPTLVPIPDQRVMLGETLALPISATDPDLPDDALTIALTLSPATSRLTDGSFVWTPQAADLGEHDVAVRATDRDGHTADEHFIVRVIPVNGPPVAKDDLFVTPRGQTTTLTPLGNDLDPDGDALMATVITQPRYGALTDNGDGTFGYRPGAPAAAPFEPVTAYRFIRNPENQRRCFVHGRYVVGDVDADGQADIIGRCQFESGFGNLNWLVMFHANPGTTELELVWATHTWGNGDPGGIDDDLDYGTSQPALADLDKDGTLEIVMPSVSVGHNVIFDHLGQVESGPMAGDPTLERRDDSGYRTIADLDGDGFPEILAIEPIGVNPVVSAHLVAWDRHNVRLWATPLTADTVDRDESVPVVVADLDLDGTPEILVDRHIFNADGTIRWSTPAVSESQTRTFVAAANLDDDAFGEIVIVNSTRGVEVRNHDGSCLWRARPTVLNNDCEHRAAPNAGWPDGFLIADIDGDGAVEIVVAGRNSNDVLALRRDGAVAWHVDTPTVGGLPIRAHDMAAFDFDGDGVMEIVLAGANAATGAQPGGILFLDGRDGTTRAELVGGVETGHPYYDSNLVIADLDGDRAADLFVAHEAGVSLMGNPTGLWVYKSAQAPWSPTRPVWNQWSYAITNATLAGHVPATPEVNWLTPGMNNFRVNLPLPEEEGASDRFTYRAHDATFESNTATVVLDIRRPNAPPVILGTPPTVVGLGETYHAPIRTADPDLGDVVTVELAVGPEGMALGSDNALYWATTQADLGEHPIVVTATDLEGGYDLLEYTLRVVEPQPVPDVIGETQAAATTTITTADFVVGRVLRADHPSVPEGAVMEQTPAAGSLAVPGSAVALVVSTGPGPADRDEDDDDFTPNLGDCDDANAEAYPGATDPQSDGIDQDCDGIDGSRPVASIMIEPDALGLLVGERKQLKAWGIFADGSAQEITGAVTWSVTGTGASVTEGGVLATAAGSATVTATRAAVEASIPVTITAKVAGDATPPAAVITAPAEGESVFGVVAITGTASDDNLVHYDLELAPANTNDWRLIASGTGPVQGGTLGELDGTTLVNGAYFLRLTVLDAAGLRSTHEITVVIDGQQKLGLFTLAFSDLTLPTGTLPIEITRTYDSRDKTPGDFGVGWDLELTRVKVQCATPTLGEGWFSAKGGLAFALLPERAHTCTIELPGGEVETFDFAPTPAQSILIPFTFVTAAFVARPGTTGTLESVDNKYLMITDPQPGPVALLDDTTFATYAPSHFRYTTADDRVFLIGPAGLESVTDRNGNTLTFTADGIAHSGNASIGFERDASGRITALTDPLGHTQRYAYSASGDLVAHTDALGNVTRFFYDTRHGLLRIEDPLGRPVVRSEFDQRGRLIATTDAAGQRTRHAYDDAARTMTTTYPDGTTRVFRYDARGNVIGVDGRVTIGGVATDTAVVYAYDASGNPTLAVDADGVRTESDFSDGNLLVEVIDPGGLAITRTNTFDDGQLVRSVDPIGRVASYTYDARGNVIGLVSAGGRSASFTYGAGGQVTRAQIGDTVTRQTYDGRGNVSVIETVDAAGVVLERTELDYDANARLIAERRLPLDGGAPRTTTWVHDANGQVTAATDAAGATTHFEYDAAGQRTAIVDPLGARTEFVYDARGLLREERHPDGGVETFAYDFAGRRVSATDASGVITETEYDELGRKVATRRNGVVIERLTLTPGGRTAAATDAAGHRTDYEHDAAGRVVRVILPEVKDGVSGALVHPEIAYELDLAGRRTALTDPNGARTRTTYDAAGFPAETIHPDDSVRATAYDAAGRLVAETDEDGQTRRFAYDGAGRLISVVEPGDPAAETRFVYDAFGEMRARIDALGRTTSFAYDADGRPTRRVIPGGRVQVLAYDVAGRVVSATGFDGRVVTLEHDAMGRVTRRIAGELSESMTWSAGGLPLTTTDARGTTEMTYDAHGRLATIVDPHGAEVEYRYLDGGRLAEVAVDGVATTYTYDALDRLASVTHGTDVVRYDYDRAGHPVRVTLPSGVTQTTTFDPRGRPLQVEVQNGADVLARYAATWSARGQRTRLETLDGAVETYAYDAPGRLVAVTRTGANAFVHSYAYDPVGNRVREVRDGAATDFAYGPSDELLSATTGGVTRSFTYDARGNRLGMSGGGTTVTYAWDAFDRLASVSAGGTTTSFAYDVEGRRVERASGGAVTRFVHDRRSPTGYEQVLEERGADGDVAATFTWGTRLLTSERGGEKAWPVHDGHGNTRQLLDQGGAVSDRYDYLPFGETLAHAGASEHPYLFAGERFEPAAGAYDLRARSYDPATGVFLSRDAHAGEPTRPMSFNPYQYAGADPINKLDPSGLFSVMEINISSALQNGLNTLKSMVRSVVAKCKSQQVAQAIGHLILIPDAMMFFVNVFSTGGIKFGQELHLPDGAKLILGVTPFYKDNFPGLNVDMELEWAPLRGQAVSKQSMAIEIHKGAAKIGGQATIQKPLAPCGIQIGSIGLALKGDSAERKVTLKLIWEFFRLDKERDQGGSFDNIMGADFPTLWEFP